MPIEFTCPECGSRLRVPDYAAGREITCPDCQARNRVPDSTGVTAKPAPFPPPKSADFPVKGEAAPGEDEERRRPCPMCGEMILASAIKCRYCGEVFDETLRRRQRNLLKKTSQDNDLDVAEYIVAILFAGIGCIIGIIWMIQGKPKGTKMFVISLIVIGIGAIIMMAAESAQVRP